MISIDYGNKIILVAKAVGMNLKEFAKALPVAYSTLRNYTDNGVMPPMDFYRKMLGIAPNLNQMWWFCDQGDIFNEDLNRKLMEMVMKINDLYEKLEAERDKNMKADPAVIMDVMKRNHAMLGTLEQNYQQLRIKMEQIASKVVA